MCIEQLYDYRLQNIVMIIEHLYDYRTLCKFWSHGEKQMSTKGAVMVIVVKKPKIGIEIHIYFIPLFQQQRNSIWRADKTTVLQCICWNFMLSVLEKACRNPFTLTSIGLWENPECIHSLHGCCKNSCIRRKKKNHSRFKIFTVGYMKWVIVPVFAS